MVFQYLPTVLAPQTCIKHLLTLIAVFFQQFSTLSQTVGGTLMWGLLYVALQTSTPMLLRNAGHETYGAGGINQSSTSTATALNCN